MTGDLQKFVALLTSRLKPGEFLTSSGFVGDPTKQPPRSWAASQVRSYNGRWLVKGSPEWNRYITVAAFRPDPETGRIARQMELYAGTVALMVDDVGTKIDFQKLRLPPTAAIETSAGNFQLWYVFEKLCRGKGLMDALVEAFVVKFAGGVDPGMKGVTRVGRVPESTNGKPSCGPNRWPVRLVTFRPGLLYTPELLARAWGLNITPKMKRHRQEPTEEELRARVRRFNEVKARLQLKSTAPNRKGRTDVVCPWIEEHTGRQNNGASIFEPSPGRLEDGGNDWFGGFKCHHGHCADKHWRDVDDLVAEDVAEYLQEINAAASTWESFQWGA
jgi:hypothetical protein